MDTVAWQHALQQIVPSSSPSHAVTLLSTQEQSQSLAEYVAAGVLGAEGCCAMSSVAWGGASCVGRCRCSWSCLTTNSRRSSSSAPCQG